jgi:DNA-binding GntR family transcriptional regulator
MRVDLIETRTLHEQAYRKIKKLILQNDFMPGEYLSINSLATALGISHTPVREALARLQTDGLIHYESNRRLRVSDITEEDVSQVYDVRKILEPHAATLVIASLSKDSRLMTTVERLREKAEEISKATPEEIDFEEYLQIDLTLNDIFTEAAGKTLFRDVLTLVENRSLRIRMFAESASKNNSGTMIHGITKEHLEIIDALLERDTAEAKAAVLNHLKNGELRTLKTIKVRLKS